MKMNKFVSVLTIAFAALMANVAAAGDIYEFRRCNELGQTIDPTDQKVAPVLKSGMTGYFKLRLVKHSEGDEPFKMRYTGTGSSTLDEIYKAPTIGILVNGVYTPAKYVTQNFIGADGPGKAIFTDLIFSYTVQAGDFAQPIVLCNQNREPITDLNGSVSYYLNFRDASLGTPVWNVDTGTEGTAGYYEAAFSYATDLEPWADVPPDGERWTDYDLAKANLQVKALDFAPEDPAGAAEWRVVYQNGGVSNDVAAQVYVLGVPTTSTSFYLWSEDEEAFWVVRDRMGNESELMDITVGWNGDTPITVKRHVLRIDTIPNRDGIEYPYAFELRGGAAGSGLATNLILSGFHDFNWKKQGVSAKVRAEDFLSVKVRCCDPRPPSVTLEVTPSPAYAPTLATYACDTWTTKVKLEFTQAYDADDVVIELKPEMFVKGGGTATRPWSDYIRFAEGEGVDVTLQKPEVITQNPRLVVEKGHLQPTYLETYPYGAANRKKLTDAGIVYVYGLYADDESNGKLGQLQFAIDTENAGAKTAIDGWYKTAGLVLKAEAPVATMLPPVASVEATRTEAKEFSITVADVYLNRDPANSYELYYQTVSAGVDPLDNAWAQIPGEWKLSDLEGGVLKAANAEGAAVLPKVTYNLTGDYDTYFYVKGANGLESAKLGANALKVKVTVKKANAVYAEIATSEEGPWVQSGSFDEGQYFYVRAHLDNKLASGKNVYVFLAPADETACDFVDYAGNDVVTNVEGAVGLLIRGDATETEDTLRFRLADGVDPAKTIKLDVLLCETEEWDPAKRVLGFEQDRQLSIKARNLPPAFKQVMMGDNACVNKTGETMHDLYDDTWNVTVPLNVEKTFTFNVTEVDKDKKAEGDKAFKLKYTIRESDRTYPPKTDTLEGNPSTANFTYAFQSSGTATITLQMQDKDMVGTENEWTEPFTFKVEVTAKAGVTLDVPLSVDEDKTGAYELAPIDIGLSDGVTRQLKAMVAVVPVEKTVTDVTKLGFIRIGGCDNTEPTVQDIKGYIGSDTTVMAECYAVTLDKSGKRQLFVDACDGTKISQEKGYKVYAFVVDAGTDPEGQPWTEHYLYESKEIKVKNASPSLLTCDLGATIDDGDSFTNSVGIGVDFQIKYTVGDIEPDLTNGITAVWTGASAGNGLTTNIYDNAEYAATVRFSSSGLKILQLTLTDKDKTPFYTGRWYFLVESTKTLVTIPNGPTAKGDSTLSTRYAGAVGRGEGHVWANATFASADSHYMNWNCDPSATSVRIYGYGYKTNAVDNGTLDSEGDVSHDIAITPMGNSPATPTTGYYAYAGELDSFLYGWITYASASGGGGAAGGGGASAGNQTGTFALSPEIKVPTPTIAQLPTTSGNNATAGQNPATATYPTTYAEAVFSRELLPSDNLGDMNQDAVPDAYLVLNDYSFGIVDAATGASTGDDLRDVNFTQGGEGGTAEPYCADYLPTTETAAYAKFIPGLSGTWVDTGRPFVPRMKVRGFDEDDLLAQAKRGTAVSALNDAPAQVGMASASPDRIYTNPREDAASTLNYVEWLAWSEWATAKYGPDAVSNATHFAEWSPERPTNPTKADTDGDGLTDGWEYYIWYNAHVGYIENGVHKYLTGRAYDPRNPGAGKVITSAEIKAAFDPQTPTAYKLRDLDNDGLTDAVEFELGTNPFDFDSDGDGLPDGFEILLNGTDPLNAFTTKNISDAMRNYDGDAMAFTTPELEEGVMPKPMNIESFVSFATVNDAFTGDSDGVQWYVGREFTYTNYVVGTAEDGHVIQVKGERYFTTLDVKATDDGRLATDLTALGAAWKVVNAQEKEVAALGAEIPADLDYIRLAPARLAAGTRLELIEEEAPVEEEEEEEELEEEEEEELEEEEPPAEPVMVKAYVVDRSAAAVTFGAKVSGLNAAWIYGSDLVSTETTANNMLNLGGFGMLAMGRYLDVEEGAALAELPSAERPVALMHYLVYQEFGFDPRTAWNAHTPLAARWGSKSGDEVIESQYNPSSGYAGIATRTREFTAYDEFLLLSFWLENGTITDADVTASEANPWYKIWSKYTTNPQGPGELWEPDNENFKGRTAETASDTNGADTDQDGVPDGWELYVMAGPKVQELFGGLKFNFAGPYNDNHFSHFGPFEADAASASWTDASATSGYNSTPGDGDGLTELREFAGTDSCNWYSKPQNGNEVAFSTTIVRPDADAKWLNKFFPTDPWNKDTDMDGIPDGRETSNYSLAGTTARFMCGNFIYGTPVDNGSTCIPGGGLNPLTIDTDGDGLPDLWEAQFAGSKVYDGPDAELTKDADGKEGNPKQGLCDGMDGTVQDAFTYPLTVKAQTTVGSTNSFEISHTLANGMAQVVDRDYDHDGLQNWQEYLTGMMRCWRYDDPLSRWDAIPEDVYYKVDGNGKATFDVMAAAKKMFPDDADAVGRFWYETLVNVKGEWYNPHLITGMSPANYMTRVTNPWDKAFTDEGSYYWMVDRIGEKTLDALWCDPNSEKCLPLAEGMSPIPLKYACCSPIDPDSDHDGLDDYYELFHGMNPLLGASGVLAASSTSDSLFESAGPCDLVYDAWYLKGPGALEAWAKSATDAQANFWQRDAGLKAKHDARFAKRGVTPPENGYDFEVYPWLNGLQMADPDGDDIRNLYESIQPKLSGSFYLHTDPTPLWMTDSTYSNSLVRLFFRLQTRPAAIELAGASFEYDGTTYFYRDFDGFKPAVPMVSPDQLVAYTFDKWSLTGDGYNWLYSFEENEGYDSDHDFVSDYEEAQGTKRAASDPQDADSPRHRQAIYFPGYDAATGAGSVLQTPPEELEKHPLGVTDYPDSQLLQNFTVEAWVRPESVDPNVAQTVLERAVWVGASQVADKEYMRKNFQIAIRNGKWYVKFDTNGTEPTNTENGKTFEFYSAGDAGTNAWTHVAVTYDGTDMTVFLNGVPQPKVAAHLPPANGTEAVVFDGKDGRIGDYWYGREYKYHAFVVGASVKGTAELGSEGYRALDISQANVFGWNAYHEFFRGYVDEIRVWDGARKQDDVISDYTNRKRYSRTDALENRSAVYQAWLKGQKVPELLHHWSFDSVAGAENATQVAKWPRGFGEGDCPAMSRPDGYEIDWWKKIVDVFGSVYAGKLDWVTWMPDTVAHLPRFDGTTLDSAFWSDGYAGIAESENAFPLTAEPVTRWTQMTYGGADSSLTYRSTGMRHRLVNELFTYNSLSTAYQKFEFTGRNRTCSGTDLLPLGGAFVKFVDAMWDDQGASTVWDQTGSDANANGLPDWWEAYADQNYRPDDMDPSKPITWDTEIVYDGMKMKAGEAYLLDLAKGFYVDEKGKIHRGPTEYAQTADVDDDGIPDWWEDAYGIHTSGTTAGDGHADADYDNDGLSNRAEYLANMAGYGSFRVNNAYSAVPGVLDYFVKTADGRYVGEAMDADGKSLIADHDFMEDAWEDQWDPSYAYPYGLYANRYVYDAHLDADEDGWSNWAECRAYHFGLGFYPDIVDTFIGGDIDAQLRCFPQPAIGLHVTYNGRLDSSWKSLVVRTRAANSNRPDAIFAVDSMAKASAGGTEGDSGAGDAEGSGENAGSGSDVNATVGGMEKTQILGLYNGMPVVHGHLNPGLIVPSSVKFEMTLADGELTYYWTCTKCPIPNHVGKYLDYITDLNRHGEAKTDPNNQGVTLNETKADWELFATSGGATDGRHGEIYLQSADVQESSGRVAVGTIDYRTGEYSLDLAKLSDMYGLDFEGKVLRANFAYNLGAYWPQTVWLSYPEKGYVKEGKNTIEAFFDLNGDGLYTVGEPYGVLKDVDIGWHKTSELRIELCDGVYNGIPLFAIESENDAEQQPGARTPITDGTVKAATLKVYTAAGEGMGVASFNLVPEADGKGRLRIVRTGINGAPATQDRMVYSKNVDVTYGKVFTAADLIQKGQVDFDARYLVADAAAAGISAEEIMSAEYTVYWGADSTEPLYTFTRTFDRYPIAPEIAMTSEASYYTVLTAQPELTWKGREGYGAFVVQVAEDENFDNILYAATNVLPHAGNLGYTFKPDLYVGEGLKDQTNYFWRVAQLNAKFTENAWSKVAKFSTAVNSENLNTGYGRLAAEVRYYGPSEAAVSNVVVGVYESGDFRCAPIARLHLVGDAPVSSLTNEAGRAFTTVSANAVFDGIAPGEYFVMAFVDANGNGVRDPHESWGYVCKITTEADDLWTPVAVPVSAVKKASQHQQVLLVMEDTDINQNMLPDCLEAEDFPDSSKLDSDGDGLVNEEEEMVFTDPYSWDTDGDGMSDGWEKWAGTDPLNPDGDYAAEGDVMAYAEVDRTLVTFSDGSQALVVKGVKAPEVPSLATTCNNGVYDSVYAYGDKIGLGAPFTVTDTKLRITKVEPVKVVLVHSQVYDAFGYDMTTANPVAFADGKAANTKEFTALDKYLVWAYLRAIGYTAETAENAANWAAFTLKPGKVDQNVDGIADGWQLYVMFNGAETAACTPWTDAGLSDDKGRPTPGGEGLTWVQEYDNGHYPTDPWNAYTIGDRFTIDGVEYVISDKDAYAYHLKHFKGEEGDKYADFDNDGLVNYQEYVIQKNNNRTLSADEMFSYFGSVTVPTLAGQCVPDYFLKSTNRNAKAEAAGLGAVYDYLGFDYSSHDFLESSWKDRYGLSRMTFDPYGDGDGDGWDNLSEARARKDPTKVSQSAIDGYVIDEFPIPMISLSLETGKSTGGSNATIVVQARLSAQTEGMPDAVWNIGGRSAEAQEKFLGFNPGITKDYNLGGAIVPGSFELCFKDLTADHETYLVNTNDSKKTLISSLKVGASENVWANAIVDTKIDNDSSEGYLVDRNDGDTIYGKLNYETGDVTVYFDRIVDDNGEFGAWHTWNEDQTECVVTYYWKSYVRANWTTRAASLSAATRQDVVLSDANEGQLRQGLNTFTAFADANGNGAYDPGEPFGSVANVQVGWDKVVDIKINLSATSPVMPRFDAAKVSAAADDETEEGGEEAEGEEKAATVRMIEGKPVITDVEGKLVAKVVRWKINDEDCFHRTVLTKYDAGVVTEADVLGAAKFDLDWKTLTLDAGKTGVGADAIDEVLYAVFAYDSANPVALTEENVNGWIVKSFARVRLAPTAVAPTAGDTAIVRETRPTFTFKAPNGYTAFAFELMDAAGDVVFSSVEHLGPTDAAGNATYRPPVYFGWDKQADTNDCLFPNGTYTWHVAMLNAKYDVAGDWSADASFAVELAKGKVQDSDRGILDVTVRYYGDAEVSEEHPIVVQAFKTADFTGVPEGQAVITNTDLLASYDNTNAVNAKIYGLPAGDYYVCAFIDTKRDVRRMCWESWGYRNNVGTDKADLYTPVETTVMRNDTSAALVFIEDMDCDGDDIPDALQPDKMDDLPWVWPWPEPPDPTHGEGEEEPGGGELPPWFPGAEDPEAEIPNDFMAYEDLEGVTLVRVGLTDEASAWYAVMDLQNEGVKLRDSTIAKQTPARDIRSLVTTWDMGNSTGIGTNVVFTGDEKVWDVKQENIRLVHAQVYANNGFETGCAAASFDTDPRLQEGIAAAEHPHTKNFTVADKYYFFRYLEAIGVEGVSEKAMLAEIERAVKNDPWGDPEEAARKVWTKYCLDPGDPDADKDSVADGWEAYVMFGVTDLKAFTGAKLGAFEEVKVSPFNTADGMLVAPGAGSQLKLVEEFDGGYWPTDPWSVDTSANGEKTADGVIDYYAYQYHLKGDDAGKDFDLDDDGNWVGDGLSNYAEYLISEVFKIAKCDPEKVKTDGHCVDYFQKFGQLYLGEVFTDHDQVADTWEALYPEFANRYVYDPDRDDDKDGWTNYEEFRAGTDPSEVSKVAVAEYTKNEYPIPVIKAKVVYNGSEVNLGSIVFKAWNEKADQDMTGMPDAIWTFGNGEKAEGSGGSSSSGSAVAGSAETGSSAESNEKYLGRRASGQRRMVLGGGEVVPGTVAIKFMDEKFEQISTSNMTAAADALWYVGVTDEDGKLVDFRKNEIGTVDYQTGLVTFDCAKMTGKAIGLPNSTSTWTQKLIVDTKTAPNTGGAYYDVLTLDNAHMLIVWQAKNVGLSPSGEYLLADVDQVTNSEKSGGHVRSGKNTFFCFADTKNVNGEYDPGEPFGVVRGVDVGWQGAEFTVEIAETSAITPRIALWGGEGGAAADDRSTTFEGDFNQVLLDQRLNGVTNIEEFLGARLDESPMPADGKQARIRVVRYAIDDLFSYVAGVGSPNSHFLDQLVVMDKVFNPAGRDYLCEADFLGNGKFDIDWGTLTGTSIDAGAVVNMSGKALPGGPQWAELGVTNMTYLVVIGEGAKDVNKYDSNTVHVVSTLVTRRFEKNRSKPVIDANQLTFYSARPTFTWSMPNEEAWAKKFGSSYTAFRLQILDGEDVVYDSDIVRAPKQDAAGNFSWTAPLCVGSQTPQGKMFEAGVAYTWRVTMYNAKFRSDAWSDDVGKLTMITGNQQDVNDHGYSLVNVAVKYAGPAKVLEKSADLTTTQGVVRVQAFSTADFSGEAVAEAVVTSELADVAVTTGNAQLLGLPVGGTYYVRAFIDMNGNGRKDAWESWGYAKEPVVLTTSDKTAQIVGLYIEDADTDRDWLPDAWEYAVAGWIGDFDDIKGNKGLSFTKDANGGRLIYVTDSLKEALEGKALDAGISSGLNGVSLTALQNLQDDDLIQALLGLSATDSIDAIRAAVEAKVKPDSLKITSLTMAENKIVLTVDADVAYEIAGMPLNLVYSVPGEMCTVRIRILKKNTLIDANWTEVYNEQKPFEKGKEQVELDISDAGVDFSSGFYKVEVVQ